jgi:hypothetical protein
MIVPATPQPVLQGPADVKWLLEIKLDDYLLRPPSSAMFENDDEGSDHFFA